MFRRVWENIQMVWAQLIQLRRYSEKKRHPFECAFYSISMYNVKIINGRVPFKVVRCHIGSFHRNEMYALSNNILETK